MENINNIITSEIPIQPIENPITLETSPTPPKSNLFKYLFIICFILLLISVVSSIFILNNKNTKLNTVQLETENNSQLTPTITTSPIASEAILSSTSPDGSIDCYQNEKYFIALKDRQSENSQILVKLKTKENSYNNCLYNLEKTDYEIIEWTTMVLGLENNYLLTDAGTGPGIRELKIYDLDKKIKIYDDYYDRPIKISNNTISYWEAKSDIANKTNCSNLAENENYGFQSIIETYIKLDLITLKKELLGEDRCIGGQ